MTRRHMEVDCKTGEATYRDYTPEEEVEAEIRANTPTPVARDLLSEFDILKKLLISKRIIQDNLDLLKGIE